MFESGRRLPPLLMVGIGFLLGLFLVALFSSPRVELILPAPDAASVPATTRIQIAFSQPMDTSSLVSHLEITPDIEGRYYWEADHFIFQPEHPWPSGEEITVELQAGARSQRVLPLWRSQQWQFTVGEPRLVYLWPAESKAELYVQELDPQAPRTPLTQSLFGVEDYSVSPDGAHIAYTAVSGDGGTSIHLLDLIQESDEIVLECDPTASCRGPAFSPDGSWIAFEEHRFAEGAAGRLELQRRQIGLVSLEDVGQRVLLDLQGHDVWGPSWSPNGWLTYYDEMLKAVVIMDVQQVDDPVILRFIPNGLGLMGTWSPDGRALVLPEIVFSDGATDGDSDFSEKAEVFYSHLYRVEPESGRTVDISPGDVLQVEDAAPTFHPDGEQLAFTRRYLEQSLWTPGRQIWIMDAETQRADALTGDANLTYSALAWSPEGGTLAFMRRNFGDVNQSPELGWLDLDGREETILVQSGFLPAWIP